MKAKIPHPVQVAIIEDNRFSRKGMEIRLKNESDFKLIGAYRSCEEAFHSSEFRQAEIVVLDIRLPGMSGVEGVRYIRQHYPDAVVLICSVYQDNENVFEAIVAGAVGVVAKKSSPEELLSALRLVAKGGSPMTPNVARRMLQIFRNPLPRKKKPVITATEWQVLELLAAGNSYPTVAAKLGISETAVHVQVRKIYRKLQSPAV